MATRFASNLLFLTLASVLVAGSAVPAAATDEEKKAETKSEKQAETSDKPQPAPASEARPSGKSEEVKVFTNEDLERLASGTADRTRTEEPAGAPSAEPASPAPSMRAVEPPPAPPVDPLTWMKDRQALAEERQRKLAAADAAVKDAEQRVTELEKRLLSVKNPFLARPKISDEEKEEWDRLGAADRVKLTEDELAEARQKLADARKERDQLR